MSKQSTLRRWSKIKTTISRQVGVFVLRLSAVNFGLAVCALRLRCSEFVVHHMVLTFDFIARKIYVALTA